jgi:hypothetical protein
VNKTTYISISPGNILSGKKLGTWEDFLPTNKKFLESMEDCEIEELEKFRDDLLKYIEMHEYLHYGFIFGRTHYDSPALVIWLVMLTMLETVALCLYRITLFKNWSAGLDVNCLKFFALLSTGLSICIGLASVWSVLALLFSYL